MRAMAVKERSADRGRARGRRLLAVLLEDVEDARRDRGLSFFDVGRSIGLSQPAMSRLMAGQRDDVGVIRLATIAAVVGLDLGLRAYAGGQPLRDMAHAALLKTFRARLHPDLDWGIEVPLPGDREQRAWDGFIRGRGWRYGVEAETHPTDAQALARRLELKRRDGHVDGVLLVLPRTAHVRLFIRSAGDLLYPVFPVRGGRALEHLGAGVDPGGSAIIVL